MSEQNESNVIIMYMCNIDHTIFWMTPLTSFPKMTCSPSYTLSDAERANPFTSCVARSLLANKKISVPADPKATKLRNVNPASTYNKSNRENANAI